MPRRLAVTAVVLIALTTSGCSRPTGSAAVIGSAAVAESVVRDDTDAVIARSGATLSDATRATVARTVTTQAIRSRLLADVAAERGVSVSQGQVDGIVEQADVEALATQLQVSTGDVPSAVRDVLTLSELFAQLPPDGVAVTDVLVTVEGVQVATRDEAVARRTAFLADPSAMTAEIARGAQGSVATQRLSLLTDPGAASVGLYRAEPGSVVLYPSQTGYLVLRVVARTEEPGMLTAAAVANRPPTEIRDLGALLLAGYAGRTGVSVNPRYGVWDALALQVVPAGDGL